MELIGRRGVDERLQDRGMAADKLRWTQPPLGVGATENAATESNVTDFAGAAWHASARSRRHLDHGHGNAAL